MVEKLQDFSDQARQQNINTNTESLSSSISEQLASILHEEWRAPRLQENGTFESRIKTTKDSKWITENGTQELDIANTDYSNLPEDWKGENKISAEIATELVLKHTIGNGLFDTNFIEQASSIIHDKWLERNGNWAPAEQQLPYNELSEEEKEKDRAIIIKAIELFNSK